MIDAFAPPPAQEAFDAAPASPFQQGLQRLRERNGFIALEADGVDAFVNAAGDGVILLTDDPQRCPEAWDMVVVLPEALDAVRAEPACTFRRAYAAPALSRDIAAAYGISRYPALLFVRGADAAAAADIDTAADAVAPQHFVDSIEGMRDWLPLLDALRRMPASPVRRRPGIGIAVRSSAPACH